MAYHDLSESTLTADERLLEAERIIEMLEGYEGDLRPNEKDMMANIEARGLCSTKQIFWLRDIAQRVL